MSENTPDEFSILATSSRADEHLLVIKHGESFGVFDHGGAIRSAGLGELGLYHEGTRFLSWFEVALERRQLLLLGSTVRSDNVLVVDLANPDFPSPDGLLTRDSIHVFCSAFLWDAAWYARLRLHNYALHPVRLELTLLLGADYVDIFEVRGAHRDRRGRGLPPEVRGDTIVFGYEGLDRVVRRTRIRMAPAPAELRAGRATYSIALAARGEAAIDIRVGFETDGNASPDLGFDRALEAAIGELDARRRVCAEVSTSNARFDAWLDRSASDVQMMVTRTPHGPYPYAGVPWYSTPFGRDGILTAYELLWLDPALTRGALAFLAAHQALATEPERDAEPGKIVHEMRGGEMAATGEVPFGRYYGTIDATPMFVMLAGAYWRRTADRGFVEALWPAIERALAWIERHGDVDGDGFVEYARRSSRGLSSQGWKDSVDSISHRDGTLAEGPIALCEVQGYVYAAWRAAATVARVLGDAGRADHLDEQADALRERFEHAFWSEELGTYCIALDGAKQRCEIRASNAGHCLFAGIASPARARRVADTLLADSSFSGWGIRTLDAGEVRYNPISYHNGSVWPHDNAVIAAGLARYGRKQAASAILSGLFDASLTLDLHRMPELFCGFKRRPDEGPTLYPVACAPQAWSAGAVFLLLQACLGIDIDATRSQIVVDHPVLPDALSRVVVRNLRVGAATADLVLIRHDHDVSVHLERRDGDVAIVVVK